MGKVAEELLVSLFLLRNQNCTKVYFHFRFTVSFDGPTFVPTDAFSFKLFLRSFLSPSLRFQVLVLIPRKQRINHVKEREENKTKHQKYINKTKTQFY